MLNRQVRFTVYGIAEPQGSAKAFIPKGWKRPIITSDNRNLRAWRDLIASQAQSHAAAGLMTGPVSIVMWFHLPRPASLPKRITSHTKKPDIDKLARAVLDSLTGVLLEDDRQVYRLEAQKEYARPGVPCHVEIWLMEAAPARPDPTPDPFEALFPEGEAF